MNEWQRSLLGNTMYLLLTPILQDHFTVKLNKDRHMNKVDVEGNLIVSAWKNVMHSVLPYRYDKTNVGNLDLFELLHEFR